MTQTVRLTGPSSSAARCIAAGALAAILLVGAPALAGPTIGQPAPTFVGTDSNGKIHDLADYQGNVVVLEWTNHECPYTVKHYESGAMQSLQKDAAAADIVWLSVISSAPGLQGHVEADEANALTTSRGAAPRAVLLDPEGDIGRLYDASTTPQMYVINTDGTLVYNGAIDDDPSSRGDPKAANNHVQAALTDLAAGRAVQTAITRPYGCSVKYRN